MHRPIRRGAARGSIPGAATRRQGRSGRRLAALSISMLALLSVPAAGSALNVDLYAGILKRFSREVSDTAGTRVDYRGLTRSAQWRELISSLESTDPAQFHSRDAKLAFWINAYNILAMDIVVRNYPVGSIRDAGSIFRSVWIRKAGTIGGRAVTLDEIEHDILRPMGEPRIHAAIVCASVSCPPLAREPFVSVRLDAQLDSSLRRWLADPRKGLRLDRKSRTVQLSRVFDWFEGDFENRGGVLPYLHDHLDSADREWLAENAEVLDVEYLDYDWSLNILEE